MNASVDAGLFLQPLRRSSAYKMVHQIFWEVYGGVEGTKIDNDGMLEVASNETVDALFVTARLVYDPTRFATAVVNVVDKSNSGLKILTKNAFLNQVAKFNGSIVLAKRCR